MNHRVPNFPEMEDDEFSLPELSRPKGQEEIMELLWQNGQVVAQTQKMSKKLHLGYGDEATNAEKEREIGSNCVQQHLFMQEDEMASWLQYPLDVPSFDHRDLYGDLIYSTPPTSAPPRPFAEIRPPSRRSQILPPPNPNRIQNFLNISRIPTRNIAPTVTMTARDSTVVESNETPVTTGPKSIISPPLGDRKTNIPLRSGKEQDASDIVTVSSSPSCSGASFSTSVDRLQPPQKPMAESVEADRKRKSREADYQIELEATDSKKQCIGSTSTNKSRAAQVHNLSERRRRDRINEKMRVLQELIPRCNKSDKASMLDEAIEYLKSLQLQIQMMSMGCGMVPMMYPNTQQYLYMSMMGMGMDMSTMMPYPSMLPASALQNPAAHMNPCFPMSAFHLPQVPVSDPSRIQPSNHTDSVLNPAMPQNPNPLQMPNINKPSQQFFGLHQSQPPLPQNRAAVQPNIKLPGSNNDICNPERHQSG